MTQARTHHATKDTKPLSAAAMENKRETKSVFSQPTLTISSGNKTETLLASMINSVIYTPKGEPVTELSYALGYDDNPIDLNKAYKLLQNFNIHQNPDCRQNLYRYLVKEGNVDAIRHLQSHDVIINRYGTCNIIDSLRHADFKAETTFAAFKQLIQFPCKNIDFSAVNENQTALSYVSKLQGARQYVEELSKAIIVDIFVRERHNEFTNFSQIKNRVLTYAGQDKKVANQIIQHLDIWYQKKDKQALWEASLFNELKSNGFDVSKPFMEAQEIKLSRTVQAVTPLEFAIKSNNYYLVANLLSCKSVCEHEAKTAVALKLAVKNNRLEIVSLLLQSNLGYADLFDFALQAENYHDNKIHFGILKLFLKRPKSISQLKALSKLYAASDDANIKISILRSIFPEILKIFSEYVSGLDSLVRRDLLESKESTVEVIKKCPYISELLGSSLQFDGMLIRWCFNVVVHLKVKKAEEWMHYSHLNQMDIVSHVRFLEKSISIGIINPEAWYLIGSLIVLLRSYNITETKNLMPKLIHAYLEKEKQDLQLDLLKFILLLISYTSILDYAEDFQPYCLRPAIDIEVIEKKLADLTQLNWNDADKHTLTQCAIPLFAKLHLRDEKNKLALYKLYEKVFEIIFSLSIQTEKNKITILENLIKIKLYIASNIPNKTSEENRSRIKEIEVLSYQLYSFNKENFKNALDDLYKNISSLGLMLYKKNFKKEAVVVFSELHRMLANHLSEPHNQVLDRKKFIVENQRRILFVEADYLINEKNIHKDKKDWLRVAALLEEVLSIISRETNQDKVFCSRYYLRLATTHRNLGDMNQMVAAYREAQRTYPSIETEIKGMPGTGAQEAIVIDFYLIDEVVNNEQTCVKLDELEGLFLKYHNRNDLTDARYSSLASYCIKKADLAAKQTSIVSVLQAVTQYKLGMTLLNKIKNKTPYNNKIQSCSNAFDLYSLLAKKLNEEVVSSPRALNSAARVEVQAKTKRSTKPETKPEPKSKKKSRVPKSSPFPMNDQDAKAPGEYLKKQGELIQIRKKIEDILENHPDCPKTEEFSDEWKAFLSVSFKPHEKAKKEDIEPLSTMITHWTNILKQLKSNVALLKQKPRVASPKSLNPIAAEKQRKAAEKRRIAEENESRKRQERERKKAEEDARKQQTQLKKDLYSIADQAVEEVLSELIMPLAAQAYAENIEDKKFVDQIRDFIHSITLECVKELASEKGIDKVIARLPEEFSREMTLQRFPTVEAKSDNAETFESSFSELLDLSNVKNLDELLGFSPETMPSLDFLDDQFTESKVTKSAKSMRQMRPVFWLMQESKRSYEECFAPTKVDVMFFRNPRARSPFVHACLSGDSLSLFSLPVQALMADSFQSFQPSLCADLAPVAMPQLGFMPVLQSFPCMPLHQSFYPLQQSMQSPVYLMQQTMQSSVYPMQQPTGAPIYAYQQPMQLHVPTFAPSYRNVSQRVPVGQLQSSSSFWQQPKKGEHKKNATSTKSHQPKYYHNKQKR